MADKLNRTRIRDTGILIGLTLLAGIFCTSSVHENLIIRTFMEASGYVLCGICALGRVYSSAFIGGLKNKQLVTSGPYSFVRNPLYFYSLLGAAGIGLSSTHVLSFLVMFLGLTFIYIRLIAREEGFLDKKFGKEFQDYASRTPRLWPRSFKFSAPAEMTFQPKFLIKAFKDAVWWFAPPVIFQLAHTMQDFSLIHTPVRIF